jgi:hypothetical protein
MFGQRTDIYKSPYILLASEERRVSTVHHNAPCSVSVSSFVPYTVAKRDLRDRQLGDGIIAATGIAPACDSAIAG